MLSRRIFVFAVATIAVLAVDCSSGSPGSGQENPPEAVAPPGSSPRPAAALSDGGQEEVPGATADDYAVIADRAVSAISTTARLLSGVGIQLSLNPGEARLTEGTVRAAIDTFALIERSLSGNQPPESHVVAHAALLDAIDLYSRAAAFLLPDAESGMADFWAFQGLFPQGGRRFHDAGAAIADATAAN